jgi:endonuclease I
MKRLLTWLGLLMTLATSGQIRAGTVPPDSTIFPGQTGATLRNSLISAYKSTSNLGYDAGRDTIYGVIDKYNDSLECVYSGYKIYMQPGQDPSTWAYDNDINCEHTWPQSLLGSSTAVSDLHHLFPTEVQVNGDRGNYPFGDIPDAQTTYWYRNNIRTTSIPTSNINEYAEYLSGVKFEPREIQKGNTARAMYYILTFWQLGDTNDAWWTGQRDVLYAWHVADPADAREITRTKKIATYQQGKPNPFVLDSTLIRRAYFPVLGVEGNPGSTARQRDGLRQNSPNPFIQSTQIAYSLSSPGRARIEIYNLLGQMVRSFELSEVPSGSVEWDGRDAKAYRQPPGVYFFRLVTSDGIAIVKRMLMLK